MVTQIRPEEKKRSTPPYSLAQEIEETMAMRRSRRLVQENRATLAQTYGDKYIAVDPILGVVASDADQLSLAAEVGSIQRRTMALEAYVGRVNDFARGGKITGWWAVK